MKRAFSLMGLFMLIGAAPLAAHSDTELDLKDGILHGLPKEFQPAAFDLEKKILTISGKSLQFPASLVALFPDARRVDLNGDPNPVGGIPYDLKFSASWYHGPALLPPYLQISITPRDRNFRSEIVIDIESVAFIEANVFLEISEERTEFIPILIEKPIPPPPGPNDWLSIIGKWRAGPWIVEFTKDEVHVTEYGEVKDYPMGKIAPIDPEVMSLVLPNGREEIFSFWRKGDILELGFERWTGGFARLGSPADEAYQRRASRAEPDSAAQPATAPESKLEDDEIPQLKSGVRPQ